MIEPQVATHVLLVTYVWPPTGGVGVTRVLKLAKYLPGHGITPTVLTASNPSVPLIDPSLARDIAPDLAVVRARSFEPGYAVKQAAWRTDSDGGAPAGGRRWVARRLAALARQALIPDPQLLWQPGVLRALAGRLSGPGRDDVVFITAPPFSTFLASPFVRLWRRAGLVLDYRDEWTTLRSSYEMLARTTRWVGDPLERALVRCADEVTVATEPFREQLLRRFSFLDPARVHTVPNGYDPDDFPRALPAPPTDRLVMTYAGTVYKLTSPGGLLRALRTLRQREPALAALLRVRFIGRIVETEQALFEGTEALGVERVGFVPKDEVLPALAASHVVLVIQGDEPGTERIYPGKMMEALYLRRPMLILSRAGAATELARRHSLGVCLPPGDDAAITTHLVRLLRDFRDGQLDPMAHPVDIERYHRRAIAGEFARIFRAAAARARRRAGAPA
jgi:glycosyltransferase involved in cell wall biosynthesis